MKSLFRNSVSKKDRGILRDESPKGFSPSPSSSSSGSKTTPPKRLTHRRGLSDDSFQCSASTHSVLGERSQEAPLVPFAVVSPRKGRSQSRDSDWGNRTRPSLPLEVAPRRSREPLVIEHKDRYVGIVIPLETEPQPVASSSTGGLSLRDRPLRPTRPAHRSAHSAPSVPVSTIAPAPPPDPRNGMRSLEDVAEEDDHFDPLQLYQSISSHYRRETAVHHDRANTPPIKYPPKPPASDDESCPEMTYSQTSCTSDESGSGLDSVPVQRLRRSFSLNNSPASPGEELSKERNRKATIYLNDETVSSSSLLEVTAVPFSAIRHPPSPLPKKEPPSRLPKSRLRVVASMSSLGSETSLAYLRESGVLPERDASPTRSAPVNHGPYIPPTIAETTMAAPTSDGSSPTSSNSHADPKPWISRSLTSASAISVNRLVPDPVTPSKKNFAQALNPFRPRLHRSKSSPGIQQPPRVRAPQNQPQPPSILKGKLDLLTPPTSPTNGRFAATPPSAPKPTSIMLPHTRVPSMHKATSSESSEHRAYAKGPEGPRSRVRFLSRQEHNLPPTIYEPPQPASNISLVPSIISDDVSVDNLHPVQFGYAF